MSSSIKVTFSPSTNQDSDLMTLGYISLLPLHVKVLGVVDANPSLEVRGVFLDLSKTFDSV